MKNKNVILRMKNIVNGKHWFTTEFTAGYGIWDYFHTRYWNCVNQAKDLLPF